MPHRCTNLGVASITHVELPKQTALTVLRSLCGLQGCASARTFSPRKHNDRKDARADLPRGILREAVREPRREALHVLQCPQRLCRRLQTRRVSVLVIKVHRHAAARRAARGAGKGAGGAERRRTRQRAGAREKAGGRGVPHGDGAAKVGVRSGEAGAGGTQRCCAPRRVRLQVSWLRCRILWLQGRRRAARCALLALSPWRGGGSIGLQRSGAGGAAGKGAGRACCRLGLCTELCGPRVAMRLNYCEGAGVKLAMSWYMQKCMLFTQRLTDRACGMVRHRRHVSLPAMIARSGALVHLTSRMVAHAPCAA